RQRGMVGSGDLKTKSTGTIGVLELHETVELGEIFEHDGHGGLTPNAFALLSQPTHDLRKPCPPSGPAPTDSYRFVTSATLDGISGTTLANEGSAMAEVPVEIKLTILGNPDFLRLARLASASAAMRPGLTFS